MWIGKNPNSKAFRKSAVGCGPALSPPAAAPRRAEPHDPPSDPSAAARSGSHRRVRPVLPPRPPPAPPPAPHGCTCPPCCMVRRQERLDERRRLSQVGPTGPCRRAGRSTPAWPDPAARGRVSLGDRRRVRAGADAMKGQAAASRAKT